MAIKDPAAKAERLKEYAEKDKELLFKELQVRLKKEMGVELELFCTEEKSVLPGFCLRKQGACIGFADVMYGKREEYLKVKMAIFRNGIFFADCFGIPADASMKKCHRFRYVIFLIDSSGMFKWVYKPENKKAYPLLETEDGRLVYIEKKELAAV